MLLMIDNYDSFTYNLVHYFQMLGQDVLVKRNDAISTSDIARIRPQYIVISPGPHAPEQAGISLEVIATWHPHIPLLGVCLGHQCLAHAFGASVIQASQILHGQTSAIFHRNRGLFKGIPQGFQATRYHSLMVDANTLPECLQIDAETKEGTIMAISHRQYPLFGLQFHPEAILSEYGLEILNHFLNQAM